MLPLPLDPAADPAVAAGLVALQRASYAVEAALVGSDAIPPLHESADGLAAAGLTWWGLLDADGIAAAVAVTEEPGLVDVHRLVVAPRAFRRGLGRALVRHVLDVAGGRRVVVSTGRDNAPARALYRAAGFTETDEREVVPGLWVTHLARDP